MEISFAQLALYAGAVGVLWATPGPVWLALSARALTGGFRSAWPLAVGVTIGDVVWPLLAIFGLSWIVGQHDVLMNGLRWVAAGIFVAMGWGLIAHARRPIATDGRLTRPGMAAGFTAGVAAILGNPKAILFYMGVLPGFFDLGAVTAADVLAIVTVSMVVPLAGNLAMAAAVAHARARISSPRILARINTGAGILLILVAFAILLL